MFFFKQKTAYEMRSSDWSSDVCSSDLPDLAPRIGRRPVSRHLHALLQPDAVEVSPAQMSEMARRAVHDALVDRGDPRTAAAARSAARLVGTKCVTTCSSRCSPYHYTKPITPLLSTQPL